jgi:hypothetical protein
MHIRTPCRAPQVRFKGCKGMLVPWGEDVMPAGLIQTRPSMRKFESHHAAIEVVRTAVGPAWKDCGRFSLFYACFCLLWSGVFANELADSPQIMVS